MTSAVIDLAYVVAAVLFILGLKGLTHPRTAVRGNMLGALGMLLAVVVTLFDRQIGGYTLILIGLAVGTVAGVALAYTIRMTAMPQLVALFNGFGGGASALVAGAFLTGLAARDIPVEVGIATTLSGLIGAVTLSGSLVAFGKLQELKFVRDLAFPGQHLVNAALFGVCVLISGLIVWRAAPGIEHSPALIIFLYWLMVLLALALGVLMVTRIGGADMPVVIALLNSYSGLAAAGTGFVLFNNVLIISGALVGASGIILTRIMCQAMNRSLVNVMFGTLAPQAGAQVPGDEIYRNVKSTSADEVAMLLEVARRVVIIPGYGMAVAQAQHAVRDLTNALTARGVQVDFGIHPVAGRMPGHMNVLLAEADIPYDLLKEMSEINPTMDQVDVALVVGANDVVNPLARTDPKSPIAGMPIIDVDKSRTVVIIKRSLSPGFAGIPNPLFSADNALMFYADARKALVEITNALQAG